VSPAGPRPRVLTNLALAAAVLLAARAAAGPGDPADADHPFETLLSTVHSGLAEPRREVVRNQAAWSRLWADIHAGETPPPARPEVDFERSMLIAVASGTRPSGGFAIKVRRVASHAGTLEVLVLETCPAPGAMTSAELTRPVEVVRVPRLAEPLAFQEARAGACH
jgi:hypothetical protein